MPGDVEEPSTGFIRLPENAIPGEWQALDGGGEVVGRDDIDTDTVLTSVDAELGGDDVIVIVGEDDELDEVEDEEVEEDVPNLGDTDGIL